MKKTDLKKLRIGKETLLHLGSRQMHEAAGAVPPITVVSCFCTQAVHIPNTVDATKFVHLT